MSNATLFDLVRELQWIYDTLEENGGEITDELNERLNINRSEMKEKIAKYEGLEAKLEGDNNDIDAQIKRLQGRKKRNEAIVKKLQERVVEAVLANAKPNITKTGNITYAFEADGVKANISRTFSMKIEKVDDVPEKYKKHSYSLELDSEELRGRVTEVVVKYNNELGIEIPEAEIVDTVSVDNKTLKDDLLAIFKTNEERERIAASKEEEPELLEVPTYAMLEAKWNVNYK